MSSRNLGSLHGQRTPRSCDVILSVVVPVFNTAKFVEKCLKSILKKNVPSRLYEVIVVDDGSTDESYEIAKNICIQYAHTVVLRQSNSGLGAARNSGLEKARGEYVWFIDGDDFLQPHATDKVLDALERHAPDILVVDFSCANENGQPIDWITCPFAADHGRLMGGGEFFCRHQATTYAWLYVFRRELLVGHGLRFQPRINMQDAELLPRVMAVANKVLVSGIRAYVYVKRAESFINNPDPEVRERYFRSVIEVRRRLVEFLPGLFEPAIRKGVTAKLNAINKILLMAYVYDPLSASALSERLGLLRSEGIHPFGPFSGASLKVSLLRVAVNVQPILFPKVFKWIRDRPSLRYVARHARRNGETA